MKTNPLFLISFLYLSSAFILSQESAQEKLLLPSGISLAYGIGSFAVTVVVLINGSTFSAGELCTEVLKQLPNVTAVGDTTGGGSLGSGEDGLYFLPSGKSMEIGFIDLRCYDGLPWEWLGIPPDIRVEQTEADILAGRDKQLEYAIEMLQ